MCVYSSHVVLTDVSSFPTQASTVSTKSVSTTGSLQRSRSDIDVNAAASAKSKVSSASGATPFSSAAALPPGSYASLGNQTPTAFPPVLLFEMTLSPAQICLANYKTPSLRKFSLLQA